MSHFLQKKYSLPMLSLLPRLTHGLSCTSVTLLVMTLTTAHLYLMVFSLPICPPPAPLLQLPNIPTPPDSGKKWHDPKASLEKCFDPRCSERNSSQTCEGIVSCYWCVYNKDSVPLKKSYCATAEACFRGKEGLTIHCLSINVLVWYLNRKQLLH